MLKAIPSHTYYWTYENEDSEVFDADFDTQQEAQADAETRYSDRCDENGERGYCEEKITLIRYFYDDEDERSIVQRIKSSVAYEYYHGDYAEHNTNWGL